MLCSFAASPAFVPLAPSAFAPTLYRAPTDHPAIVSYNIIDDMGNLVELDVPHWAGFIVHYNDQFTSNAAALEYHGVEVPMPSLI